MWFRGTPLTAETFPRDKLTKLSAPTLRLKQTFRLVLLLAC